MDVPTQQGYYDQTATVAQMDSPNPPIAPVDEDTAKEFMQRVEYAANQAGYHEECARRWRATMGALQAGIESLQSVPKANVVG